MLNFSNHPHTHDGWDWGRRESNLEDKGRPGHTMNSVAGLWRSAAGLLSAAVPATQRNMVRLRLQVREMILL
jgi:hypothetical protein